MEQMTAAFSSTSPVRLDNIIVYSGPPAAKNQKTHRPRPAPTTQERDDLLPPVAMRTDGAGVGESGSGSETPNDNSKLASHQCWTGQADWTF